MLKNKMLKKGTLNIIGIGPGALEDMTLRALRALKGADIIVGYSTYTELIKEHFPEKQFYSTGMKQERERCEAAVEMAASGKNIALISSGDSGIYGMAGLVFEISESKTSLNVGDGASSKSLPFENISVNIIPGITAAVSGAALLGAPLANGFAAISLSDLLTPWQDIEEDLRALAESGLVTVIYNPGSKKRTEQFKKACSVFLEKRSPDTICAVVSNIARAGEEKRIMALSELVREQPGMNSAVFIGNRDTKLIKSKMITSRGYGNIRRKTGEIPQEPPEGSTPILIFGGTSEGSELAALAAENGYSVTLSAASGYGTRAAKERTEDNTFSSGNINIVKGNMDELINGGFKCVISAVHPFAADADSKIQRLARERDIKYYRVLRDTGIPDSEKQNITVYADIDEIIDALNTEAYEKKRVFFSTGSRWAGSYSRLKNAAERAVIRCLPDERAVSLCLGAGFSGKNMICMQGPFSEELNEAMFKESGAEILVTKLSGKAGGTEEKLRAAKNAGMQVMAVSAGSDEGMCNNIYSIDNIKQLIYRRKL